MSTAIPEFLWLQDYEARLEFMARDQRRHAAAGVAPLFLAIR